MKYGVKCPVGKDFELLVKLEDDRLDVKVLDCSFFIYLYGVVEAIDEESAKMKFKDLAKQLGAPPLAPVEGRFDWIFFSVNDSESEGIRGATDLDTRELK